MHIAKHLTWVHASWPGRLRDVREDADHRLVASWQCRIRQLCRTIDEDRIRDAHVPEPRGRSCHPHLRAVLV
jgi:hypothetical protein